MNVELVAIGEELIRGQVAEQNCHYLARELFQMGFVVSRHTILPDDPGLLRAGLDEAMQRADLVICTGGLGPTCDDHSREVAAELFSCGFRRDAVVAQELERRYGSQLVSLEDQARVPEVAEVFLNTVGTAPGLLLRRERGALIMLPGVPPEVRCLFKEQVGGWLQQNVPADNLLECRTFTLGGVSESEVDPLIRSMKEGYPELQVGIYPRQGLLTVQFAALQGARSDELLEMAASELRAGFGDKLFSLPSGLIEDALQIEMIKRCQTLAVAESCTGGALSSQITSIPGASGYFLGGVVSYSNEIKKKILGVSEETLQSYGAVSEPVVQEMVLGVYRQMESDWALAVSGIAGPSGGTEKKPVGTVCAALARRGEVHDCWTFVCKGSREMIIAKSSNLLLFRLYQTLMNDDISTPR